MMVSFLIYRLFESTGIWRRSIKRYLPILLVISIIPSTFGTAFSAEGPLIKLHINVALIRSAFLGSNENDAAAAFKTFAKTIGKRKGYDMEITVSTFDNASELTGLPKDKRPHVAILDSWSFLELEKEGWLTPVAATSNRRSLAAQSA